MVILLNSLLCKLLQRFSFLTKPYSGMCAKTNKIKWNKNKGACQVIMITSWVSFDWQLVVGQVPSTTTTTPTIMTTAMRLTKRRLKINISWKELRLTSSVQSIWVPILLVRCSLLERALQNQTWRLVLCCPKRGSLNPLHRHLLRCAMNICRCFLLKEKGVIFSICFSAFWAVTGYLNTYLHVFRVLLLFFCHFSTVSLLQQSPGRTQSKPWKGGHCCYRTKCLNSTVLGSLAPPQRATEKNVLKGFLIWFQITSLFFLSFFLSLSFLFANSPYCFLNSICVELDTSAPTWAAVVFLQPCTASRSTRSDPVSSRWQA